MAKERLHELKQTTNSFQVRGIVSGTKSKRFYTNGTSKGGNAWNAVELGVKIAENKYIYVKLNGFTRDDVFYYKKGESGAKGTTTKVQWKDRHKAPSKDHRLIGVNISTGKNEDGKNINKTFVVVTGSKFTEVDTGDEFLFDETSTGTWTKVKAGWVDPDA